MGSFFNWVLNLAPVISVVVGWFKKIFSVKLIAFLALKGIIFFLFYKYLPVFFSRCYQWVYDLGAVQDLSVDLSGLSQFAGVNFPAISGLAAWLFVQFKLDVCFRIALSGAVAQLTFKRLPFLG